MLPRSTLRRDRPVDVRRELLLVAIALAVTLVASLLFLATTINALTARPTPVRFVETLVFLLTTGLLIYGSVVFQVTRAGYLVRLRRHDAEHQAPLPAPDPSTAPSVVVLVPSYKEEPTVVRRTLLSAALQEHPGLRVVLLIDDPTAPRTADDRALLRAARALPDQLHADLDPIADRMDARLSVFEAGCATATLDLGAAARSAIAGYRDAAAFLRQLAAGEPQQDHTDRLFVAEILAGPAAALEARATAIAAAPAAWTRDGLRADLRRLATLFRVESTSFERKAVANLPHEPNKAMNLNAYLSILGGRWTAVPRPGGIHLEPATAASDATLVVPPARYVVTLDADSLLAPGYIPRLVALMEEPGNERVAVAQTPYSAIPDATSAMERVAGATTDVQYLVHQGFTRFNATFWVGANALIRWDALRDLEATETERGHAVKRYIHDRTVIEDTESSVDLADKGWRLVNLPERLSYSATPPDFGALLIQRRRWANGGLIIVPSLLRSLTRTRPPLRGRGMEGFLRLHYLVSIAAANGALLVLLLYPFPGAFASVWLPVTAIPYFALYTRSLRQAGYEALDMVRVYALNLVLLPVNLAGVVMSVRQGLSGRKIPFGRTPKVEGRTGVPALHLVAQLVLVALWSSAALNDGFHHRTANALFAAGNVALLVYGVVRFIGPRAFAEDLAAGVGPVARRARAVLSGGRMSTEG
ncbi:MAG: glycosyltransferase family 2 protein [Chloroflexota bacterium]